MEQRSPTVARKTDYNTEVIRRVFLARLPPNPLLSRFSAVPLDFPYVPGLRGLQGFEDHFVWQLSGGMRQRVGLARALACRPAALLMDEPFGALDAITRDILQDHLQALRAETGQTILFVTHSVDEALYLSDRIAVMGIRPGRVLRVFPVAVSRDQGRERMRDQIVSRIPLGRIGTPEDIGGTAIWLSSRAGAYITGAVIPVSGGYATL